MLDLYCDLGLILLILLRETSTYAPFPLLLLGYVCSCLYPLLGCTFVPSVVDDWLILYFFKIKLFTGYIIFFDATTPYCSVGPPFSDFEEI